MIEERAAGVLMPIFALPSGYSSGNFGRCAYDFVDLLKESGFSYWQVLPFTVTDHFHSPYASPSAFSLNPLFLDLEDLVRRGLLREEEIASARELISYACEYDRLLKERLPLLALAASRFTDDAALDRFLADHPYVEEYCRFEGLKASNGGAPWQSFAVKKCDKETYRTYAFFSYIFWEQWSRLRAYANEKGVSVIGDIPIYVSLDGADVFFHQSLFLLAENGYPTGVAGVPPDYFSSDGQLWGNPLYNWQAMKEDGFSFWRARIRHMLSLFDGVRLDHFRGFDTYFDIPSHAKTAREGVWREGPRFSFVDMLKEEAGDALFIAEDLGELFPSVGELLAYSGFPGMRVFAFAFDGEASDHLPYRYPHNTVAYSGTHDNNTLLGFFHELPEDKRIAFYRYCGYEGNDLREGCRAAIKTLYASHAGLVIFPIQDILFFGGDTRFNTPGRALGNWAFRVSEKQLYSIDKDYFRTLSQRYGRI
ncbi:MAG: 4-alpha-glucanotransferase [Ruminococcaceae bacterium]|nr:4-alpha-glucanotransferase [Oscillospiraceae bacterium]